FLGAPASDPASPALAVSYSRAAQAPRKPGFRQMPPCAACSHAAPGSLRSRTAFGLFSEIRPPTPDICSAFPAPGSTLGALRAALCRLVPLAFGHPFTHCRGLRWFGGKNVPCQCRPARHVPPCAAEFRDRPRYYRSVPCRLAVSDRPSPIGNLAPHAAFTNKIYFSKSDL